MGKGASQMSHYLLLFILYQYTVNSSKIFLSTYFM